MGTYGVGDLVLFPRGIRSGRLWRGHRLAGSIVNVSTLTCGAGPCTLNPKERSNGGLATLSGDSAHPGAIFRSVWGMSEV